MSPRYRTSTYLEAPHTLPGLISLGTKHAGKSEAHNLAPEGGKLMAPQRLLWRHPRLASSSHPLLTALFFYHTGNQIDSGVLKPFVELSDWGL